LHPIMPFITEEIWRQLGGDAAAQPRGMPMTAPWPDLAPDLYDPAAVAEMAWGVAAISALRAVGAAINVPPAARVPLLVKDADGVAAARLERHREAFLRLARLDGIEAIDAVPAGGVPVVVEGATLILRLGEVVDLAREKSRLAKEIGRLDGDLTRFATKLANPAFLAKAKAEIIEEQREREAEARRDRDRLNAAYERLDAI